jgi:predicted small lipoprotein YifL
MSYQLLYTTFFCVLVCLPLTGCDMEQEGPTTMPPAEEETDVDVVDVPSTEMESESPPSGVPTSPEGRTRLEGQPGASAGGGTSPPATNGASPSAEPSTGGATSDTGDTIEDEDVKEIDEGQP